MKTSIPDTNAYYEATQEFCMRFVPGLLQDVYKVNKKEANGVGRDIFHRAYMFATLDQDAKKVLSSAFAEEVFDYEPRGATLELRAAITVVVRNSKLENLHASDVVGTEGLETITKYAASPLAGLLSTDHHAITYNKSNELGELKEQYPKAWACLTALSTLVYANGGRQDYKLPNGPVPPIPTNAITPKIHASNPKASVQDALAPEFDSQLLYVMSQAAAHPGQLCVLSSLSRISRDMNKLMYTLEFLLSHKATVLTTNYLLRPHDVWVRIRKLIQPTSLHPLEAMQDMRGLRGSHKYTMEEFLEQQD